MKADAHLISSSAGVSSHSSLIGLLTLPVGKPGAAKYYWNMELQIVNAELLGKMASCSNLIGYHVHQGTYRGHRAISQWSLDGTCISYFEDFKDDQQPFILWSPFQEVEHPALILGQLAEARGLFKPFARLRRRVSR